jgi:hypothetical protein
MPVSAAISRRIWLRLELLAETERVPLEKLTWARLGGTCNGLGGTAVCCVVTDVAGSADEVAFGGVTGGDCAHRDAERMRLAANVICVGTRMLMRRVFPKEVMASTRFGGEITVELKSANLCVFRIFLFACCCEFRF